MKKFGQGKARPAYRTASKAGKSETRRSWPLALAFGCFVTTPSLLWAHDGPPANYSTPSTDQPAPAVSRCPVTGALQTLTALRTMAQDPAGQGNTSAGAMTNSDWWPNQLNLRILRQNSSLSDPIGDDFDYAK